MSLSASDFLEKIDGVAPATVSFDLQHGRATLPLYVRVNRTQTAAAAGLADQNADSPVLPIDLIGAPQTILGGVDTSIGTGRLTRLLPFAHPQWPWLYASAVSSVRGIGTPAKATSISPLEAEPLPYFSLYPIYEFTVEFTTRNYAVLPDDEIFVIDFPTPWTDLNNIEAVPGDQFYATEWWRFTEYQVAPQTDWATSNIGSDFIFQTLSGNSPGSTVFPAMPRMLMPNDVVKMTWHQVPYRYFSSPNSWLRLLRGYINQFAWYDWEAGELLYLSCNPIRYTPPILQPIQWIEGTTTVEKWATMELTFLSTRRVGQDLPASAPSANYIIGGHNLLPWHGNRKFYYTKSNTTSAPSFYSAPFELLWTDPDA